MDVDVLARPVTTVPKVMVSIESQLLLALRTNLQNLLVVVGRTVVVGVDVTVVVLPQLDERSGMARDL